MDVMAKNEGTFGMSLSLFECLNITQLTVRRTLLRPEALGMSSSCPICRFDVARHFNFREAVQEYSHHLDNVTDSESNISSGPLNMLVEARSQNV